MARPEPGLQPRGLRPNTLDDRELLVFAPNGTAYLTNWGPVGAGVYALTPAGAQKVADLEYSQLGAANLPTFSADGTGYIATSTRNSENVVVTTVASFAPLAAAI